MLLNVRMEKNYPPFKLLLLIVLVCCTATYTLAQSTSWTGASNEKWRNAANWTNGVPDATKDVVIGDASFTGPNQPTLSGGAGRGKCKSLTVGNGAKITTFTIKDGLDISGTFTIGSNGTVNDDGGRIRIDGDWMNSGVYVPNNSSRRVYFRGSSQAIGGSSVTNFEKLYINSGTTVTLSQSMQVSNFLNLFGKVDPGQTNSISGTGDINVSAGATLMVMGSTFATNYAVSGTIDLQNSSSVVNYGSSAIAQTIDQSVAYRTLYITGSTTKTLAGNTTVQNDLLITGGTLDLSGFTINRSTAGGTLALAGGTTLKIGGTNSFPTNYNTHLLATNSTVEYNGGNQTIADEDYGNLTLSSSSGAIVKTLPVTPLSVAGKFTGEVSAGNLSFTAQNTVSILGDMELGSGVTFNGAGFSHTLEGDWINEGTYSGCSGTLLFNGVGATLSGSGTNNFGNVVINGSGVVLHQNTALSVCGDFSTSGGGSFTHTTGGTGTVTLTGISKSISGSNITFDDLIIDASASISSSANFNIAGDFTANGTFTASSGTIAFTGTSKSIAGSGSIQLAAVSVNGSLTTARDVLISSNVTVSGSFTASAGEVTFNGTSTLSGTLDVNDVRITSAGTLTMGAGATLDIDGVATLEAGGTFDPATYTPNTVTYSSTGAQSIIFDTYHNLTLEAGDTKTPPGGGLTINGDFTIASGTTFSAGANTYTIKGDFVNNGTFTTGTSTVVLSGSEDSAITGATTFDNLTINKAGAKDVVLNNDISVEDLAMTSGRMLTGANELTITNDRTGNGIILGTITRDHAFSLLGTYTFEGPNTFLTITTVPITLSSITMVVKSEPNTDFPAAASVNRTYEVSTTGLVGSLVATMRFHYEDYELNGNVESAMTVWDESGGTWTDRSKSSNSTTDNWIERTLVLDIAKKWTLSEGLIKYSWTGGTNSSWSNSLNWSPVGVPGTADVAHIGDLVFVNQPEISSSQQVKKVYFDSTTPSTLTLSTGGALTVQGNIDGLWSSDASHTINVGGQTLTALSDIVLSNGVANRNISLQISTGTVNIDGSLAQSGGADIIFSGAGSLNIDGDFEYLDGTFTPSTSTVTYQGDGLQKVAGVTYYNLTASKSGGIAQLNDATTVSNDLILTGSTQMDVYSTLTVGGQINIGSTSTLNIPSASTINISGDWVNSGSFLQGEGTIVFNGSGAQSVDASTFNDFTINKPSGALTLLGDVVVNGDINVQSGTVEVGTHSVFRSTLGGTATLGAGATIRFGGNSIQINNFANLVADPTSTVEYYGSGARAIPPIAFGNLTLSNGGANAKTMVGPTAVQGTLTVNSGSTLTAPSTTLTLGGDFTVNGSFNHGSGAVILSGSGNVNGNITYNDLVVSGTYVFQSGSATAEGDVVVSATGNLNTGTTPVTSDSDFTNSGVVTINGPVTFTGTKVQSIRLLNSINSGAGGVVNFNGTVSPVLNSTTSPQFATVNVNNTAPIIASQPWLVVLAMNVASGATWNGGPLEHTILGNFDNDGTVESSGRLRFAPTSSVTVDLGAGFNSSNEVEFGGSGLITLVDHTPAFESVIITNTNAAGLSAASDWSVSSDVTIGPGATFKGGSSSHTVSGQWTNNGTFDGETSTVTFNSTSGSDAINGAGDSEFFNIVFPTSTVIDVVSDISVYGDFTNNATTLNLIDQAVRFEGSGASTLSGITPTVFEDLEVNKSSNVMQLGVDASVSGFLTLTAGALSLNGNMLSVLNNSNSAITSGGGYILSESTTFSGVLTWTVGSDVSGYIFPFGNSSGDLIPLTFNLNSGDAGNVSIATYATATNNLPMPPGVSNINNGGVENSANMVDRYYSIELAGHTSPNVDVTFSASASEVGSITSLRAQRWNGTSWDDPLAGQTAGATSVTVPGVTQFSPWSVSGNDQPLPVEFISFSAVEQNGQIQLQWETASETNNDYFEVQKSTDGESFYAIGKVKGVGNSTARNSYSFKDITPTSGRVYYQLKQVDFDGQYDYSKMIQLYVEAVDYGYTYYPNPAVDYLKVKNSTNQTHKSNLYLYNHVGNLMLHKEGAEWDGNTVVLDVSRFEKGIYILKILSDTGTHSYKVMIE